MRIPGGKVILLLFILLNGCRKPGDTPMISKITISDLVTESTYNAPLEISADNADEASNCVFLLNDKEISLSDPYTINDAGFYSLIVKYPGDQFENDTFLFVLLDNERGEAEWGLNKWIPGSPGPDILTNETIEIIHPETYPEGIAVPMIFRVIGNDSIKRMNLLLTDLQDQAGYMIKNGILAINKMYSLSSGSLQFSVQGVQSDLHLNLSGKIPVEPSTYTINGQVTFDSGNIYTIKQDLIIESLSQLSVLPGCILLLDEGVNIINHGNLSFIGGRYSPVTVTCSEPGKYWGGIISGDNQGNLSARNSFFCRSGFHDSPEYQYGHAKRQALFYIENGVLEIESSYFIDNIGQVFYSNNASVTLDSVIVSGAKTGGQINNSSIVITHSFFTDFPDYSYEYQDNDNDCLYLHASDAVVDNCVFMYSMDDGIDSGGDGGGEVNISNCVFDGMFHEGLALSSGNDVYKTHHISNCRFINCGQGVELGYSSPNHSVYVTDCLFEKNLVGIRYGDNYPWTVEGNLYVSNTSSLNNYDKDVWNMVRLQWGPDIEKMHFENTIVSKPVPEYPELILIPVN